MSRFDTAVTDAFIAMLNQNAPSFERDRCMYRSEVGCCFIGHMITDEHYSQEFENSNFIDDRVVDAVKKSIGINRAFTEGERQLLLMLQGSHDDTIKLNYDFNVELVDEDFNTRFLSNLEVMFGHEVEADPDEPFWKYYYSLLQEKVLEYVCQ